MVAARVTNRKTRTGSSRCAPIVGSRCFRVRKRVSTIPLRGASRQSCSAGCLAAGARVQKVRLSTESIHSRKGSTGAKRCKVSRFEVPRRLSENTLCCGRLQKPHASLAKPKSPQRSYGYAYVDSGSAALPTTFSLGLATSLFSDSLPGGSLRIGAGRVVPPTPDPSLRSLIRPTCRVDEGASASVYLRSFCQTRRFRKCGNTLTLRRGAHVAGRKRDGLPGGTVWLSLGGG